MRILFANFQHYSHAKAFECTIESVTYFPEEKEDPLEQYCQNAIDKLRLKAKEFEKDSENSEVGPDVQLIIPSRLSEYRALRNNFGLLRQFHLNAYIHSQWRLGK